MNSPQDPSHADALADATTPGSGSPACVMSFNASDPSGASGIAADIATMASMGAHTLPVITSLLIRDTAEVFEIHEIDVDAVADQARTILEDISIAAWKVGFLGSAEGISVVAEILSDYTDIPLVAYLPNTSWMDEDAQMSYLDAFRELIVPAAAVLVGNHKTLTDFLLPEWESERPPSARELAAAASESGCEHVLVTGMPLPDQFVDNVLSTPQGPLAGERFERFEASFVGAGDTLSAALAAILSTGTPIDAATVEALSFLDQSLDAGFRPGMGGVVPDRFFWALPPGETDADQAGNGAGDLTLTDSDISPSSRNVH